MRRTIGVVLLGLGALLLVMAPLLRWYAYPRLAVIPQEVTERVSVGRDVTVLDLTAAANRREPTRTTDVRTVRKIVPAAAVSTDRVAVWETSVTTFDALADSGRADDSVLSYVQERVAFNRHTAAAVNGFEQYFTATGDKRDAVDVDHTGYFFALPFDTKQRTYEYWDSSIQQTRPMVFDGEDDVAGLDIYRFVQWVEPTSIGQQKVPGQLFGRRGTIAADQIYSTKRTIWVEPQTGGIVKEREERDSHLEYRGKRGPAILDGTLTDTQEQVAANVEKYADGAHLLELVRTTAPTATVTAGAVVMLTGLLMRRDRAKPRRQPKAAQVQPRDRDDTFEEFGDEARPSTHRY
jgi:hypothetical protein